MSSILISIGIVVAGIIGLIAFLCAIYRVADVDKALIITGGKEPVIKVSGGSFVIPIFRKAQYFDLCMLTVPADSDEIKTKTSVPIVVDWTAQIRPNTKDMSILQKAIVSFKERGNDGIIDDVRLTLMGAVRGVVATLTPEEVQNNKEKFKEEIMKSVSDELDEMGLELVSLNIQDITDNNGYYDDIAAHDREEKRKEAAKVKAAADQQIRQQNAESEKIASAKELETELAIAEKKRDNDIQKAAFKVETDKANADAEIAGELQRTVRKQEIAAQEGRVEVIKQEQANLAAEKEKEVLVTKARASKEQIEIASEADAAQKKIAAEAAVTVAEKEASAVKIKAEANADKITKEGEAAAKVAKLQGIADAEIIKQKSLAQAEGEKARLLAQAEGERALAEARASNDKVNFEIEKLKMSTQAQITIAVETAKIMAEIGKNAEFVNIGGSAQGNASGNVLIDTLSSIPSLMKTLNAQNNALNGKSFNEEVQDLVGSVAGPLKGLLVNNEAPAIEDKSSE
jgi:flotillin